MKWFTGGKTWELIYLNGLGCVKIGVNLNDGGWNKKYLPKQ